MKVLYITSLDRSGSTIADMIIGAHPDIVSTGELCWLPYNLHMAKACEISIENQNMCSCKRGFYDCPIWGEVVKSIGDDRLLNSPLEYRMLFYNSSNAFGHGASILESLRRKFAVDSIQYTGENILQLWMTRTENRTAENNWKIINGLERVSGKSIMIDSSKRDIRRLYQLHRVRSADHEFLTVFLIRGIYGWVSSMKKRGYRVLPMAKRWIKVNYHILTVLQRISGLRFMTVRYEDLCKYTNEVLNEIYQYLNCGIYKFEGPIVPSNYHLVRGSSIRYQDKLEVKCDETWQENLEASEIDGVTELVTKSSKARYLSHHIGLEQ